MARCKLTTHKSTGGCHHSHVKKVQLKEQVHEQVDIMELECEDGEFPKDQHRAHVGAEGPSDGDDSGGNSSDGVDDNDDEDPNNHEDPKDRAPEQPSSHSHGGSAH